MAQSRVSGRYAKSLLDLSKEQGSTEAVFEDMQYLTAAIDQSRDLNSFLNSPIIKADKKAKAFKELFEQKFNPLTFQFLALVLKKGREGDIQNIADNFIQQYFTLNKVTEVKLTTAQALSEEMENKIIAQLKEQAKLENIQLEKTIDASILGGFVVEYDGKIMDASVKNNLNDIKKRFTA